MFKILISLVNKTIGPLAFKLLHFEAQILSVCTNISPTGKGEW